MLGARFVALLAVGTVFAGCLVEEAPDLRSIFGESATRLLDGANVTFRGVDLPAPRNVTLIDVPLIRGTLIGPGAPTERAAWSTVVVDMPKKTLAKADPGPAGGGGVSSELDAPKTNYTAKVSLDRADEIKAFQVRWLVVSGPNGTYDRSTARSVAEPYEFAAGEGVTFVLAELLYGSAVQGIVAVPYKTSINVHWVVESSVRPVRPGGALPSAPRPANYEQMADKFKVAIADDDAMLVAKTAYRGTYTQTSGTDVDLELDTPDGRCVKTSGTGGGGSPTPSAAEATERVEQGGMVKGVWQVRVGTMTEGPNCAFGTYYNNAGNVPYTLDVTVEYG